MSFLDRLNKSKNADIHPNWKVINSEAQLKEIINGSHERPAMVFKHSTTCGISAGAKYRLESDWDIDPNTLDFYYLDLLSFRSVSNAIAEVTKVVHQSPQIILLKDGEAIYDTSHHGISADAVRGALEGVV